MVPRAVQGEGVNNGVSAVGLSGITSDGLEVLGEFLNITLEGLEGNIALMLGVVRVKLETKEEPLSDLPVRVGSGASFPVEGNSAELDLFNSVKADGGESGDQRSLNGDSCGAADHATTLTTLLYGIRPRLAIVCRTLLSTMH